MNSLTKDILKYYKKYQEIINYLIVGGLTTIISFITYFIFSSTIFNNNTMLDIQLSNILSWGIAVLFAYITNRKYVFNSKSKKVEKEISLFVLSRVFSLLVDMLLMFILIKFLLLNDILSKLLVQILIIILNYILSKILVFKKRPL